MRNFNKKQKIIFGIILVFVFMFSAVGTYAFFEINVNGNDSASDQIVTAGTLSLNYLDGSQIVLNDVLPGSSASKNIAVTNSGSVDTFYALFWDNLTNTIINNEVKITLDCTSYEHYGEPSQAIHGTCNSITNQSVGTMSDLITNTTIINPGLTHYYNVTIRFIDTGFTQNYNQGKIFNGTINIKETKAPDGISTNVGVGDYVLYNAGSFGSTDAVPGAGEYSLFNGKVSGRSRNVGVDCTSSLATLATKYNNWRVIKNNNGIVTLVHAGTPECYKNSWVGTTDLQNLMTRNYSEYVNSDYATGASLLDKETMETIPGTTIAFEGGVYEDNQDVLIAGTKYFIPLVNPTNSQHLLSVYSGGYISSVGGQNIGIRPMVDLKRNIYISGGAGTSVDPFTISPSIPVAEFPNQNGLLTGYWENWNNTVDNMKIRNVSIAYNIVVVISDCEDPVKGRIVFSIDQYLSNSLGGYSVEEFKNDIKILNERGQKVIFTIGGATENIVVDDAASVAEFVSSVKNIIDTYGFNGIDINIENTIYPTYLAQAINQLTDYYGEDFILTMAPQTIDVIASDTGVISGTYYDLIQLVKDDITIVNMQLYNTGDQYGLDGVIHDPGTVDFITAYADILLEAGLDQRQIGLGFVHNTSSSGYVTPGVIEDAYDSLLRGGTTIGGTYQIRNTFTNLGGIMFYSINEDSKNSYLFRNALREMLR